MSCRFEFQSCIRGYHIYQSIWSGSSGEVLACRREPKNREDLFAVGVYKDATLVGHVPRKFSCVFSLFIRHGGTITSRVTGSRQYSSDLLQGGLEIPCVYVLEEEKLIEKACSKINDLMSPVSLETTSEPKITMKAKVEPGPSVRDSVDPLDPQAFEGESVNDVSDWIAVQDIVLNNEDLKAINNGQRLTDKHINFAQRLIQQQFIHLNGLRLTLLQNKPYSGDRQNFLLILFVKESHWVVVASSDGERFLVYDSMYESLDEQTK